MIIRFSSLFTSLLILAAGCATPQPPAESQQSSERSFQWVKATGAWEVTDSAISIESKSYDDLLAARRFVPAEGAWSMEVSLMGKRAGVFFSLDETGSKRTSHMVRFDDRTILAGYFNGGGEFTATATFDSPSDPSVGCVLRIDVDPQSKKYRVYVDGTLTGETSLLYPSGYTGLEASDGRATFRGFRLINAPTEVAAKQLPAGTLYPFAHVRAVEYHGSEACVLDNRSGFWYTLDDSGRVLRSHNIDEGTHADRMPEQIGRSYLIDGSKIVIRDGSGTIVRTISDRFGSPVSLLSTPTSFFVSDPKVNAVLEFTRDGDFIRNHDALEIGGFLSPSGLARRSDGSIAVADYDKIVVLNASTKPVTEIAEGTVSNAFNVRMTSGEPVTDFEIEEGQSTPSFEQRQDGSVAVLGAAPLTTVRYRVGGALETVPRSAGRSRWLTYTVPSADRSMRAYRKLRLLYVVYRTISYRDKYPASLYPSVPTGRTLSDEEIHYLRDATAFNAEFFFRNSGCRLLLDFDFHVVEDTLWLSEVGDRDPYWLEPRDRVASDVEKAAARIGTSPTDYDGILCTYAWMNHPPRRTSALRDPSVNRSDTIRIRQAYGGGTYGVPAPWKYGKTAGYTGNPFQDTFSRQDWLITHEFHHQLDALMYESGVPEYYHSDLPWKMPGAFGEDFDFNAAIMRLATDEQWLGLSFGALSTFRDADEDGIPDEDGMLPFDEKRLGSDPASRDTDRDGLSDLDEVMSGSHRGTSLTSKDTDADGLLDSTDPEPLYAVPTSIRAYDATTKLVPPVYSGSLGGVPTELSIGWTSEYLAFDVRTKTPSNILVQIDANNDGWFHGDDNIQLRILNYRDSVVVADYYLRDCSSWVDSPKDKKDILSKEELAFTSSRIRVATVPAASRDMIQFKIPARKEYGMSWSKGKKIAIRFAIQQQTDLWVWEELFDRNEMVTFEMKEE